MSKTKYQKHQSCNIMFEPKLLLEYKKKNNTSLKRPKKAPTLGTIELLTISTLVTLPEPSEYDA